MRDDPIRNWFHSAPHHYAMSVSILILFMCASFQWSSVAAQETKTEATEAKTASDTVYIIVHKDNIVGDDDMTITVIKELFLKTRASFPTNKDAEPCNQKETCKPRELFISKVLKMTESEYAKHWSKEKVRSGKTMPKEYGSDDKAFAKVSRETEAVSYISKKYYDGLSDDDKALVKIVETIMK